MNPTTEEIKAILDGAPEYATHYIDGRYWCIDEVQTVHWNGKYWDDNWDDRLMCAYKINSLSNLREILTLRQEVERLRDELTLSTDQNDLLLDEFVRVKLLTDNEEIHGLCERANVRMRQKVSVIDRNFKQAEEIKELKAHVERLKAQQSEVAERAVDYPTIYRVCSSYFDDSTGYAGEVASNIHGELTKLLRESGDE